MFAKIKQLLGIGLFARPLNKGGPFERAAAEVAEMESKDRARWEERENRWRAKSRAINGPKAWNTDPDVPMEEPEKVVARCEKCDGGAK